jgi:hypothetical protein
MGLCSSRGADLAFQGGSLHLPQGDFLLRWSINTTNHRWRQWGVRHLEADQHKTLTISTPTPRSSIFFNVNLLCFFISFLFYFLSHWLFIYLFIYLGARDQSQGLDHAQDTLFQWAIPPGFILKYKHNQ